jgi:hypothetical protein
LSPCPRHPYFETRIDLRYDRVAGNLELNQGEFEDENGLTAIWEDRYDTDGLAENSLIRQVRKQGRLRAYSRGTVGWALDCEIDPNQITRAEAYDTIIDRKIKSQEPEVGAAYTTMVLIALVMACSLFFFICLLSMCSGYRKGPVEDDGFWEVYNLYYRTHMVITLLLFIIMILWIPALYDFV